MSVEIAYMESAHIEKILPLEEKCFSIPWTENMFLNELKNPLTRYLVVNYGGEIIGYGGMWLIVDEAHITNIAIDPKYQSRGFGSKLLDRMIQIAEGEGIVEMTLEVRVSNRAALQLYEKFDFIKYGIRKNYYEDCHEDAIIMWRKRC